MPGELAAFGASAALNGLTQAAAGSNATRYLALCTGPVTDTMTLAAMPEVAAPGANGYTRAAATWTVPGGAPPFAGLAAQVTFGPFTAAPATITHVAVVSVLTGTAGSIYAYWALATPIVVGAGGTVTLNVGDLALAIKVADASPHRISPTLLGQMLDYMTGRLVLASTTRYLALCAADPGFASPVANVEVFPITTAGYARQNMNYTAPGGDPMRTGNGAITFGPFTAEASVTYLASVPSATSNTQIAGVIWALPSPLTVTVGATVSFNVGDFALTAT